tara:strand:+ start:1575 stop:1874 length:300 start_codon:yes stop_codon:yes gene_type:complete
MKPNKFEALKKLCPTSKFVMSTEGEILNSKLKNGEKLPNEEAIQAKLKELEKQFADNEYQRDRAEAYPPLAEQLDILYHGGLDALKAELKKTKDKYPKP